MKHKKAAAILAIALVGASCVTFGACDWFNIPSADNQPPKGNPYEVATELGYTGSESAWLSEQGKTSSQTRILYEEAKEAGYTGTFLEFLKEFGLSVPSDDTAAIHTALRSAVSVECISTRGKGVSKKDYKSSGSGVIYSLDKAQGNAYIITNYHVVYDKDSNGLETVAHVSDDIAVYLYGGECESGKITATYVGGAMDYDIAVLQVKGSAVLQKSSAKAIAAADSDTLTVGERAYAIGNPDSDGISVTGGCVNVDAEYIEIKSSDEKKTLSMLEIRTDAAVNHGNSGGGLFNVNGELIGIVNAKAETSDSGNDVESFGYAIPANLAVSVAQNILDHASLGIKGAQRAILGITTVVKESKGVFDEATQKMYIEETVVVQSVSGSGYAAAGKLQLNDVICAVKITDANGKVVAEQSVTRGHQVSTIMFNVRKNFTVEFTVKRGDSIEKVSVVFDDNNYFEVYR